MEIKVVHCASSILKLQYMFTHPQWLISGFVDLCKRQSDPKAKASVETRARPIKVGTDGDSCLL